MKYKINIAKLLSLNILLILLVFISIGVISAYTWNSTLSSGLVAYYNFSEGSGNVIHDATGQQPNGELDNAGWTTGKINEAISFNGTINATMHVNLTQTFTQTTPFSISIWVKHGDTHSMSGGGYGLFWAINPYVTAWTGGWNGFSVGPQDLGYAQFSQFLMQGNYNTKKADPTTQLIINNWTNYIYIYNGTVGGTSDYNWLVYQNGIEISPPTGSWGSTGTGTPSYSTNIFTVGGFWCPSEVCTSHWIIANFSEVGLWNRTLSSDEVAQLYNNGAGITFAPSAAPTDVNISLNTPLNNIYSNTSSVIFNCSAYTTDNTGITNLTLIINGLSNYSITNSSANQNLSLQVTRTLPEGTNTWTCQANSTSSSNIAATQSLTVDTIYPQLNFIYPTLINDSNASQNFINAVVHAYDLNFANITYTLNNNSTIFNITFTTGLCYQESATIPNQGASSGNLDGSCGLQYTGNYSFSNSFNDGNWSTGTTGNTFYYINYTKPSGALSSSQWEIQSDSPNCISGDNINNVNLSIPSDCWNYNVNTLFFAAYSNTTKTQYANFYCYNGTWKLVNSQSSGCGIGGGSSVNLDEEAMIWNTTNLLTFPTNYTWSNLTDGSYFYNVTMCDLANNCNSTETRKIFLDTLNPNITLIAPPNNTYLKNSTYNFTWAVNDSGSGIERSTVYITQTRGSWPSYLNNGLFGYWKFTEGSGNTTIDATGNNVPSVLDGAANWIPGKISGDYGIAFDGSPSTNVYTNITGKGINLNQPFTISFWVEVAGDNGDPVSMQVNPNVEGRGFDAYFDHDNPGYGAQVFLGQAWFPDVYDASTVPAPLSNWTHYVYVYAGNESLSGVQIYQNGVLIAPPWLGEGHTNDFNASIPLQALTFGAWYGNGDPNQALIGNISEVGIWNRTLNTTEIAALYNNGIGITYNSYVNQTTVTSFSSLFNAIVGVPITLVDGAYQWFADAYDYAGNYIKSSTQNFTIDTMIPSVQFVPPTQPNNSFVAQNWIFANVTVNSSLSGNVTFSLYGNNFCYQEQANGSTPGDGNCGLNYTGLYGATGVWQTGPQTAYDGNWNTAAKLWYCGAGYWGDNPGSIFINYTKPGNLLGANWQVADDNISSYPYNGTRANLIIPSDCLNYDPNTLLLKIDSHNCVNSYINYSCYNGTWELLKSDTGVTNIFEEAMDWNVSNSNNTIIFLTGNLSYSYNWTGLSDGIYQYQVNVTDIAGNNNATDLRTITLTNSIPSVMFLNGTDSGILNKSTIAYNVSSIGANQNNLSVYLYNTSGLDTLNSYNLTGFTNFNVSGLFIGLLDGNYYMNATACNMANVCSSSNTLNITIDTQPVGIAFIPPTLPNDTNISQNYVTAVVNVNSTNEVNITFTLNGNNTLLGPGNRSYNWTNLSDGLYNYNVQDCKLTGVCNSTEVRTIVLDTHAPNMTSIAPNSSYLNTSTNNFNYTINESAIGSGIQNSTLYIYNTTGWALNSSWQRRVTLSLTNYPNEINLTTLVGMNPDFSDIRFFSGDCHSAYQPLQYKTITIYSNVAELLWIANVPSSKQVCLYYYNPSALSSQNSSLIVGNSTLTTYNIGAIENNPNTPDVLVSQSIITSFTNLFNTLISIPITLADGTYKWFATSFDFAGNEGNTSNQTIIVETQYPRISFVNPTNPTGSKTGGSIPINVSVIDVNPVNITVYLYNSTSTSCYQESTNTSNQSGIDGNCMQQYTGSYNCPVAFCNWNNLSALIDGNWSTFGYSTGALPSELIVNYTKPSLAFEGVLQIEDGAGYQNLSIPSSCWGTNPNQVSFMISSDTNGIYNTTVGCYNGIDYTTQTMYSISSSNNTYGNIYEEAMNWNISTLLNTTTDYNNNNLYVNYSSLNNGIYYYKADTYNYVGGYNSTSVNNITIDVPPIISYPAYQAPADINSTNIPATGLIIIYNVTASANSLNQSSITLYYQTNKTSSPYSIFVNGTGYGGWNNKTYLNYTNNSYLFQLDDDDVYPATYNLPESLVESTTHSAWLLHNNTEWIKTELLNFTYNDTYNLFEIMANATSNSSGDAQAYYCNSSYVSGDPSGTSSCTLIATVSAGTSYAHCDSNVSCQIQLPLIVVPFGINQGLVNNQTVVTSQSQFLFSGGENGSWNVYYVPIISRTSATATSTNNAGTWNYQNFTFDAHLHVYDGTDTFMYYLNASTNSGATSMSPIHSDLINEGGVPPSPPDLITPGPGYYRQIIPITYFPAIPASSGINLTYYNITLLNPDDSLNQTIIGNNGLNTSYNWNSSTVLDGNYIISVRVYDTNNLTSFGLSEEFTVDNSNPTIVYNSGTTPNGSFVSGQINYNLTATDNFAINNITVYLYNSMNNLVINPPNTTSYGPGNTSENLFGFFPSLGQGIYYLNATVCNYAGNCQSTPTINASVDTIPPTLGFVAPITPSGGPFPLTAIWANVTAYDTNLLLISMNLTLVAGGAPFTDTETYTPTNIPQDSFYYNWSTLSQGIYNLTAYALDKAGNNITIIYNGTINIDTEPPTMQYDVPPTPSVSPYYTPAQQFVVEVSADDPNWANQTIYYWYDSGTGPGPVQTHFVTSKLNYLSQTGLADGTYYYNASATDTASRTAWLPTQSVVVEYYNQNVSACKELFIPNGDYILQADLSSSGNCLNVTASSITLDCQGYSISGNNAIYVNATGFTMKNCILSSSSNASLYIDGDDPIIANVYNSTFSGGVYGIYVSPNAGLNGDTITLANNNYGIYYNNSIDGNNLKNILMYGNSNYGLVFINSSSNTIANLNITGGGGVYLNLSTDNIFNGCAGTASWTFNYYSINNTLFNCYYNGAENIDGTSQLIRNWPFIGTVLDSAKNKMNGATIKYSGSPSANVNISHNYYNCYQESPIIPNQSGMDGNCELNYSGYENVSLPYWQDINGNTSIPGNVTFDGNWSTYAFAPYIPQQSYPDYTFVQEEYIVPINATGAAWMFETGSVNNPMNITIPIPSFCIWSNNTLVIGERSASFSAAGGTINTTNSTFYCLPYVFDAIPYYLYNDTGNPTSVIYEDAMIWNISNTTITINNGTFGGITYTNSIGNAIANITQYTNTLGVVYNANPYSFNASYGTFAPTIAFLTVNNATSHTFILNQEISSTSLSRTAMWIILGIIFLIGIAASIGFFMVRMRDGYSVVDIWKYLVILIIWLTMFTIIYYVLSIFIMGAYFPQVPTL